MNIDSFWPLALFTVAATITPGGATTLATASGAHFGFRNSIPLILGIATGLASMAAGASFGLTNVLIFDPLFPLMLKTAGTLYLLWLAWKVAGAPAPGTDMKAMHPTGYIAGLWMLWHNPKGWAMTAAAAAAYANLASSPGQMALVMGLSFGIAALASLSIWCYAGRELARRIKKPAHWRIVNSSLGALIMASTIPMWL
ncbi:LysE family translocator [Pseudomonas sp. UYIF39]|uniref:LysE family translocator n=1 Tax=unclassified Pseudomonas TaxID=196821 RepID=UPI001C588E8A|nr:MULTISPECIES: LysE family translocator [unclassified Pseudomonas]MDI1329514.1 LysE family translocator [Pseudomonas sp.]MDI3357552.1 LysE family translocator [Pseudomonas sp. UYIF39]